MTIKRITQLVKGALNDYEEIWSVVNSVQENGLYLSTDDGEEYFIEITKIEPDLE